jgi:hypothetical protein
MADSATDKASSSLRAAARGTVSVSEGLGRGKHRFRHEALLNECHLMLSLGKVTVDGTQRIRLQYCHQI